VLDLDRYLAEKARAVERFLDGYLPPENAYPASIHRAVRYSLFAPAKRLRPALALASAQAVGGKEDDALPGAAAVEMIHTYSLIHDDLPAMDNDSLRRGRPTSHVVFGEAMAILAGDALLTHAFHLLATQPASLDPARRLRAVAVLAEACGLSGLIGGQVVDLESEGVAVEPSTLEFIHRNKTGALIRAAVQLGALAGGAGEETLETLAGFGSRVGLAFQIVDDILDVEGDASSLGKTAGKDQKAKKATYPRVHGMALARERAATLVEEAVGLITPLGPPAEPLQALARRVLERRS
jgi:geranylgeranyl diphosphate synthase type II